MIRETGRKKRILYTYSANNPEIKKLHETYALFLDQYFIPSSFSHAYTKKRSIYTNAIMHLQNDIFIKIDVKNYFPSINHQYLTNIMHYELNKMRPNSISLNECRSLISNSSISNIGLPLGLIPSPVLSNIYMKKFDSLLYSRLKKTELQDVIYTRYADDIFISFKATLANDTLYRASYEKIMQICIEELQRCHLKINERKTKFINLNTSNHVKLAGINLVKMENGERKLTVSRKIIKDLYFRAISIDTAVKSAKVKSEIDETEINFIKGMQSFILSVEKKGYSHILSPHMKETIRSHGYDELEDLISNLKIEKV
jgi:hypothetical protein